MEGVVSYEICASSRLFACSRGVVLYRKAKFEAWKYFWIWLFNLMFRSRLWAWVLLSSLSCTSCALFWAVQA